MAQTRKRHVDYSLVTATFLLIVAGIFILTSASFGLSTQKFNTPFFFISRQISGIAIGLISMWLFSLLPYKYWKRFSLFLFCGSILLLAAVIVPGIGESYGKGVHRWLSAGPISFQPAEIVKLTFVIYLAAWLDSKRKYITSNADGLVPFITLIGVVGVFLILQPNISTLAIIGITAVILFFLGGGRYTQLGIIALTGLIAVSGYMLVSGYNIDRLRVFFDSSIDPQGKAYQIRQALIAVGSGGFFGKGLGQSEQKLSRLPEPIGDSIFAVFSEELGFLGNIFLLSLFVFFLWRGMLIAARAPDRFGQLLATGIVSIIFIEIVFNIAAFTGLMPVTGTPLPFISYGRTAIVMLLTSVGVLLNVSRSTT